MSKTKKFSFFWVIYVLFLLGMIGFWIYFLNAVIEKDLKIYEECQPNYKMDEFTAQVQAGDLSSMTFTEGTSRFEAPDVYKVAFAEAIAGKKITYKENPASYDFQAPIYELYAGDEGSEVHFATVQLRAVNVEPLMFILTTQDWEIASVTPLYETGSESITITIPDNYSAYVNGIALDDRERTGDPVDFKGFEIASAYVNVPKQVSYTVSGLTADPTVEIRDASGNPVAYEINGNNFSAGFVGGEVPEDIAIAAIENAKNISAIYAGDRTLSSMKYIFPEDSYLIPLFQNYINFDLWMYSGHTEPSYSEEQTSNYIRYNDNLYSVEVSFTKTMYLPKRNMTVNDKTNNTYYYALIDGKWLIVDMMNNSEE